MITEKKGSKALTKIMYHTNVNVNLMVENVIQIKNGIMINVSPSLKTHIRT